MILKLLIICMIIESVITVPTISPILDFDGNEAVDIELPSNYKCSPERHLKIVPRSEWKARPPKEITPLKLPVPYVIIHHSFIPPKCENHAECSYAMRTMQSMHVDGNGWADIGYNFGVGSDGAAYEGRGWDRVGAHALHFNNVSIGICLTGNWNDTLPPQKQLNTVHKLIHKGVCEGYISEDYKLVGHRQTRPTECPGEALFEHIKKWPHFDPIVFIKD